MRLKITFKITNMDIQGGAKVSLPIHGMVIQTEREENKFNKRTLLTCYGGSVMGDVKNGYRDNL